MGSWTGWFRRHVARHATHVTRLALVAALLTSTTGAVGCGSSGGGADTTCTGAFLPTIEVWNSETIKCIANGGVTISDSTTGAFITFGPGGGMCPGDPARSSQFGSILGRFITVTATFDDGSFQSFSFPHAVVCQDFIQVFFNG